MPGQRPIRNLVDAALGGRLNERLRQHGRANNGPSFRELEEELRSQGIEVSQESLRRWAKALDDENEQVPA